ncbi:extracellular solute-binding protein [Rubellimicrobium sp. CFH 75288]|uniref:extracellular solute-binding protein n=1 Tax=Rubellimicrobium sp. CFH 75288 TaxID=2697034 RepID=UPI001411C98F|nr:extracellular solute-binding protein [Rubellimicrobium sp. CFH 75288]NAZ37849.1 extracellular solute-binding protein [Rubellimicrobium sp. CFH 75288]
MTIIVPRGLRRPVTRRSVLRTGSLLAGAGLLSAAGLPLRAQDSGIDWRQAAGTRIVLAGLQHPWMDAIEPLVPRFTELTGIEVTVEKQSESEYVASMPVRLGAGSAVPDVFMIWSLGQAISAGWLEPLDPHRADPALFDAAWYDEEDVFSSARSFERWGDGQSYGMAITAEAQTMFYNGEALEEAGLAPPATMAELEEAAAAMAGPDRAGIAMRAKATGDAAPWTAAGFIFSHGGSIVTLEGGSGLLLPETVAGVETYGRLLREHGPLGIGNYHWMECLNDFQQGAVAIGCDSSNFATDIMDPSRSLVADHAVFGALPAAGDRPAKPNMWHWMAGINAASANKPAAFLFLVWATSPETSLEAAAAGLATTRSSAWSSGAFRNRFGEQAAEAALANLQAADGDLFKAAWFHPRGPEILDAVGIAVNEVVTGAADAETALRAADAKVSAILGG